MKDFNEFRDLVKTNSKMIHQNTTERVNTALSEADLGGGIGETAVRQRIYAKYQTLELLELYHKWVNGEW